MTGPRLSVIMPVRNGATTLGRAVESCLAQSFGNLELLLVLNGCRDGSEDLARDLARRDGRVRVMGSPEAGGVTEAMRAGVEAAVCGIMARMDADDESKPERFAKQWELLDRDCSLGAVSCLVHLANPLGDGMQRYVDWVNTLRSPDDVSRERFVECPVIQPSVMMRREALEAGGGYRVTPWAEDHDLWLRMLARGVRFGKVEEELFEWADGPGRLTRTHEMYGEDQVWKMKAHHLSREETVRERGVAICGAGPIGKRLGRLLVTEGVRLLGFFEVNPRRIGGRIAGVPVAGPEEFGQRWREAVLLSAVGVAGGRDRVRALAQTAGYEEGVNFWCCC